ncbi:MAG: hypothetical protein RBR78_00055 [Flavobacteriaceae bacterium]|jgi:hypothetical protein|nr:hypothetical protein [Flavobacteriaceae bacterium]
MKKLSYLFFVLFSLSFTACSSDDDSGSGNDNNPISGKSFGVDFNMQGGYAQEETIFGEDSYTIQVSTAALGCDASESSIVAQIICPGSTGVHTASVMVTFFDEEGDFQTIYMNNRVEITSNSGGRLKGKVNVPGLPSYNMSGTFDVPFCN